MGEVAEIGKNTEKIPILDWKVSFGITLFIDKEEMKMGQERVLAMYDISGIQDYIFRTEKVKDAIGASRLVEDIFSNAMEEAVSDLKRRNRLTSWDLKWYDENGVCEYCAKQQKDVQVLYIGGGNAFFTFRDRELCVETNRFMSKYIIENTYSLQLAVGIIPYTGNYEKDYEDIFREMNRIKADMVFSRPLGALPVMKRDAQTGYAIPYAESSDREPDVEETRRKQAVERMARRQMDRQEKIFDNYITEKRRDSTLAIVHIDGNNMGLRIRRQTEGIKDYGTAVMVMRRISYRINHSYKKVFEQMKEHFDQEGKEKNGRQNSVLKIIVAGDDITYVCNGSMALNTVEYFAKEIVGYTMDGQKEDRVKDGSYAYPLEKETDKDKVAGMGFSICAGIAFINSHFPFYAGYEVAESCCASAKSRAKQDCYKSYSTNEKSGTPDRVANWVDFQVCKNIQAQNLRVMRAKEYRTSHGEELMIRPYFIRTDGDFGIEGQVEREKTLESLKNAIRHFQDSKNMPKVFAKKLCNTYPQGEFQTELLYNFLKSRGWKLPEGQDALYDEEEGKKRAKWYDALEMLDYCMFSGTEEMPGEEICENIY